MADLAASLVVGMASRRGATDQADRCVAGDRGLGLVYFILGGTLFSSFAFLGLLGCEISRGVAALYILGLSTSAWYRCTS